MSEDRRVSDRLLKNALAVLFGVVLMSCVLQTWTFVSLQKAIRQSAISRAELYRKIDTASQNDDTLAEQLALLGKELKLSQQQQELWMRQQKGAWDAGLAVAVGDRARIALPKEGKE